MNMLKYYIDSRYHVSVSDKIIIRDLYDRSKDTLTRKARKDLYREALKYHHNNQDLYDWIMKGLK